MAPFNAATAVEPLSYTGLSGYGIPDGVIPEPSEAQLIAFNDQLATVRKAIEAAADADAPTVDEAQMLAAARVSLSALCSGDITPEQFAALPPRIFSAFLGWVLGELAPKG